MLDKSVASEVLARATSTGGDFAEIFMEDRIDHSLSMVSGKIETVSSGRLHGAGVRVFNGLNAIYVYTNDTSRQGLQACPLQRVQRCPSLRNPADSHRRQGRREG